MSAVQRQSRVLIEVASMVRDYLFRHTFRDFSTERLEEMFRKSTRTVEDLRVKPITMWDLLDLLDGGEVDLGIVIRERNGSQLTFFPGSNFGSMTSASDTPREEETAKKDFTTKKGFTTETPQVDSRIISSPLNPRNWQREGA